MAQTEVWLDPKALRQCRARRDLRYRVRPRSARSGRCRFGALPATQQQLDLLIAADQWAQRQPAQRLEPAFDDALSRYLPAAHRPNAASLSTFLKPDLTPINHASPRAIRVVANGPVMDGARSAIDATGIQQIRRCKPIGERPLRQEAGMTVPPRRIGWTAPLGEIDESKLGLSALHCSEARRMWSRTAGAIRFP